MVDLLDLAIEQKRKVLFNYGGGIRIVEPHAYGYDKKGGKKLRAYQIDGYSESGNPEGWKLFNADQISGIQLMDTFEKPRDG